MSQILTIITGTPILVWVILAYLLFIGIRLTKTQIIWLPKLLIIPFILIVSRYKIFLSDNIFIYLSFMSVGAIIGCLVMNRMQIHIIKESRSIELKGSYLPITILICFFLMRYVFGYLHATSSTVSMHYLPLEVSMNGLFAGYFVGRAICAFYKYYKN